LYIAGVCANLSNDGRAAYMDTYLDKINTKINQITEFVPKWINASLVSSSSQNAISISDTFYSWIFTGECMAINLPIHTSRTVGTSFSGSWKIN
jgi:hypothetical protein